MMLEIHSMGHEIGTSLATVFMLTLPRRWHIVVMIDHDEHYSQRKV
jgi:hypothetical protein